AFRSRLGERSCRAAGNVAIAPRASSTDLHVTAAGRVAATVVRRLKTFDGFCLIVLRNPRLGERRMGLEMDGLLLSDAPQNTRSSPNDLGEDVREMALIGEPAGGRDFRKWQSRV